MKALRAVLAVFSVVALAGGYAASQTSYFEGHATQYAVETDVPWMRSACLALVLVAAVLAVYRKGTETD